MIDSEELVMIKLTTGNSNLRGNYNYQKTVLNLQIIFQF